MENQHQRPKASDEIDLTQFFSWIGRGFNRIGNGILYGLAGLRNLFFNNRLFFLGIIILGLILGVVYSELLKKKHYKSRMVLGCDYLNTQILENTIQKLNQLSGEAGGEGLAQELNIDIKTAKNIRGFAFKTFVSEDDVVEMEVLRAQLNNIVAADKKETVDKVLEKLTIVNKNAYELSAIVYDPDIVKPLESALVNYFKNSPYIQRRIEINRANLENRKRKLEAESRKLDSLKAVLYENYQSFSKTNRGSGNVFLGDEKMADPLAVFKQDLELHEEILELEKKLYVKPDFELIDGFTTFKEPDSASLPQVLVVSFLISWVMGYLIIGAWRLDQYLASFQAKKT